jgi:hypothetical protein
LSLEFGSCLTRAPSTDGRWVIHRQTVFLIDLQRLTNHVVLRRAVTRQSYISLYLIKKTVLSACLHHICNVCECANVPIYDTYFLVERTWLYSRNTTFRYPTLSLL